MFDGIKATEKILDSIDLKKDAYEFGGMDLKKFMKYLEDKYFDDLNCADISLISFGGFLFTHMKPKDFIKYLDKRYGDSGFKHEKVTSTAFKF